MRAAIYVRVSTDEQAAEGVSLAMQEQRCRAAATASGATTSELFRDDGHSGRTLKRPAISDFLTRLDEFDLLVVWRLDRLSRSVRDWTNLAHTLAEAHVGFLSVSERFDATTPWGKAALSMLSVFSELFLDILSSNVTAAFDHLAAQGRRHGGTAFGYHWHDGAFAPHPTEAPYVRSIFERADRGAGLTTIARWLNGQHVPQKYSGTHWSYAQVREILRNPLYTGRLRWHGEIVPGSHEPLVAMDVWQRVQRLLDGRVRTRGQAARHLTPLLRCGLCGGHIHINTANRNASGAYQVYLQCHARTMAPVSDRHASVLAAEQKIIAVIWRHTELLIGEGDLTAAIAEAQSRAATGAAPLDATRKRLAELDAERLVNLEAARRGLITMEELERENAPLMRDRERLLGELARATPPMELEAWSEIASMGSERVLTRFRDEAGVEVQLLFLRGLYDHVALLPGRVRFIYVADLRPQVERNLPRYYSPSRGLTDLPF